MNHLKSFYFIPLLAAGLLLFCTPGEGQAGTASIPLDPAVRTGKLANGLTYYIRRNTEPQKQVLLYLVNKVGSILEEEDQRGLAHFMEHMNFNGTKHYPKNELEDFLQKAGVRFGADLNAHTGFDETVFELPLPTDDPSLVDKGLGIVRDWAQDALLDSTDIAEERGVVLEEERMGRGAADRMRKQYYPVLLNHSRYSDRIPIGLHNVLVNFQPDAIRSFHHDWYRPDLQAVIVVGDIDVNTIEEMVKAQFGDLKNPVNERPRPKYTIPLTGKNQYVAVTDKEQTVTTLNIMIKHKAPELRTESDYAEALKRALFGEMLAARYGELSQQPDNPFVQAGARIQGLMGGLDMFSFTLVPRKGQMEKAFREAWEVVEQVRRYGFTGTELDRARKNYLSSLEMGIREKDKTQSKTYVQQYQALFLSQAAAPSADWIYRFTKEYLNRITLADVNGVAADYIRGVNRDILLMAPEEEKGHLPDSATVTGWIDAIGKEPIQPYKDQLILGQLMPLRPAPGKVTSIDSVPSLGLTLLTFSNGVKVILKPTDFQNDVISFTGSAPGGISLCSDADYLSVSNAAPLINAMGVAGFTPLALSRLLTGKQANAGTYISSRTQGVQGGAASGDLETALQLLYLRFTQPRIDTTVFDNALSAMKASLANRYADPAKVFKDTASYLLGGYSYRSRPMSPDRIDSIDLQKAYTFYKERFADASGFTFVFTGNFTIAGILPLLERYLGGLPSLHRNDEARDLGQHIPEGQITRIVYKGSEDKATVETLLSGDYTWSPVNNFSLYTLGQVLQIKLIQHLREAAAEVYTPSVSMSYNKYPRSRYLMAVSFVCAPKNVDHLVSMVNQELETMRSQGPDPVDVEKVKAAYRKQMEQAMKTNSFWLAYLSEKDQNRESPLDILKEKEIIDQVTAASLKADAQKYLTNKNLIKFELLPEIIR